MTLLRNLATVSILAGAAIALAGPASAEAPNGPYTHTITDKTGGPFHIGGQTPWILSPCGPSCLRIHQAVDPEWDADLHLDGNRWAGTVTPKRTTSFDKDSLVGQDIMTRDGGEVFNVGYTLTKG
jgi:hypothetical protein